MGRTSRRRHTLKQSPCQCPNLGSDPYFLRLAQWMSINGWSPSCKLTLANFPDTGRGLKTKQRLDAGCTIISVPTKLMITTNTVANSDIDWIFRGSSSCGEVTAQQVLSMFLIWERIKGKNSFWVFYLQTIPLHFSTPALCSSKELLRLPKFLSELVLQQKEKIYLSFQTLRKLISSKQLPIKCIAKRQVCVPFSGMPVAINDDHVDSLSKGSYRSCQQEHIVAYDNLLTLFNYDDFLWAWFAVNSRCVFLENPSKTLPNGISTSDNDCLALAPFLDMFNHSNESKVEVSLDKDGLNYELRTLVPFKKHSQVFIHYGSHPNSKLYTDYGFFLPGNIHDSIELDFDYVFNAAKLLFPSRVDCSANKYTFIKSHSLKRDLWLNSEGLSFNTTSLIYVFLSADVSNRLFTQKIFSGLYDCGEREMINIVGTTLVDSKITEFGNTLKDMEQLKCCSESFQVAKGLTREYINVLKMSRLCLK